VERLINIASAANTYQSGHDRLIQWTGNNGEHGYMQILLFFTVCVIRF